MDFENVTSSNSYLKKYNQRTMRYYFLLVKLEKNINMKKSVCWWGCAIRHSLHCWWKYKRVYSFWKEFDNT